MHCPAPRGTPQRFAARFPQSGGKQTLFKGKLITANIFALALALPSAAFASHGTLTVGSGDSLDMTADNEFDIYVDGNFVGTDNDWPSGATFTFDLVPGTHVM